MVGWGNVHWIQWGDLGAWFILKRGSTSHISNLNTTLASELRLHNFLDTWDLQDRILPLFQSVGILEKQVFPHVQTFYIAHLPLVELFDILIAAWTSEIISSVTHEPCLHSAESPGLPGSLICSLPNYRSQSLELRFLPIL